MNERRRPFRDPHEPFRPSPLPPDLAEFLKGIERTSLFAATGVGTVLVVKLPRSDILGIPSPVPIGLRHELHSYPTAPVIRTVVTIADRPGNPLRLENFTNVEDPEQRNHFAALANQESFYMFFYDEAVRHRRTIGVPGHQREAISRVLGAADALAQQIQPSKFDFDQAKLAVMRENPL